jgi:hypothetical protein
MSELLGTYRGVALLGWMERNHAIHFLREECVFDPPLSEDAAESLWRDYRNRAAGLAMRDLRAPDRLPLTSTEHEHAQRFLRFMASMGVQNLEVLKLDPTRLIAAQLHVATDLAENYSRRCTTDSDWMEVTLPTAASNPDVNMKITRRNMDTEIVIDLPHGEFIFGLQPNGGFGPREFVAYAAALNTGNRMVLGKGYHRLYAHLAATRMTPSARSVLVALEPGLATPPTNVDIFGIFGSNPPLFSDFFTEGQFLRVYLRKKRYQLRVTANWVALNEAS